MTIIAGSTYECIISLSVAFPRQKIALGSFSLDILHQLITIKLFLPES